MIDQELIDTISEKLKSNEQVRPALIGSLLANYCQLIEDNAEMHKEIARLNHLNAHLSKQVKKDE
jgi:hypothetical protein